jgi:hypothetical protein
VAHRLGHLPEAVLWYRRAAAEMPHDQPLRENLELARRDLESLGVPPADPPGAWAFWLDHRRSLILAGIALAWAALPLLVLRPGLRLQVLMPVAALSCLSFTAGMVVPRLAPRPAVLLQPCPTAEDTKAPATPALPAGSEVWVTSASTEAGTWSVVGPQGLSCPENSVGLVE